MSSTTMEYILILEHNHKENETYHFYCQWTGNEVELEKLIRVIETAECELDGDYSDFETSRTRIPESAVDAHVQLLDFGNYTHMFQKCSGDFVCPEFYDDPVENANKLDRLFWHAKLRDFFTPRDTKKNSISAS